MAGSWLEMEGAVRGAEFGERSGANTFRALVDFEKGSQSF